MRGVLTIATGDKRYIENAKTLAMSLRVHSPDTGLALVTDSSDPKLRELFSCVISIDDSFGSAFRQKLSANVYTPFDETLFIDSDCLALRGLDSLWDVYQLSPVSIAGEQITNGEWYTDIPALLERTGLRSIPRFNSGLFYFRKCREADAVFATSRALMDRHQELGIPQTHNGCCSDEPVLSLALASHGISVINDGGIGMYCPFGDALKHLKMDVLTGTWSIGGERMSGRAAILHFLAHGWRSNIYRREALKLRTAAAWGRPMASAAGASFSLYVHTKQSAKTVVKRYGLSRGWPRKSRIS